MARNTSEASSEAGPRHKVRQQRIPAATAKREKPAHVRLTEHRYLSFTFKTDFAAEDFSSARR